LNLSLLDGLGQLIVVKQLSFKHDVDIGKDATPKGEQPVI